MATRKAPKLQALDILGTTWHVEFVVGKLFAEAGELYGMCDLPAQRIYVATHNMAAETQRRVLLHEIAHAIFHVNGASQTNKDSDEEFMVRCFETGWYHFLRCPTNKWAVDYIMRKD